MFESLKMMRLAGALKARGNASEAYSAVLELGRLQNPKAVDLLIGALARQDGVARSAARELGRIGAEAAIGPLIELLKERDVSRSASEALLQIGAKAVPTLAQSLQAEAEAVRRQAAQVLGEIGDRRAVEPLVQALTHDETYAVRTAAAAALGQLKDPRAVWALVATLKLRDETTPERQADLQSLQQAAEVAMHKIGELLAPPPSGAAAHTAVQAVAQLERELADADAHPKLLGDLALLSQQELVGVLKEINTASEEISWAKLERRQPMLPPYFREYNQRRMAAEAIGQELKRRGGRTLLQTILTEELGGSATIRNWWGG